MVKFSRELEAQLIPEWKDAFVNYRQLKKHIKKIKLSLLHSSPPPSDGGAASPLPRYGFSLLDPFRALAARFSSRRNQPLQTDEEEHMYEIELVRSRDDEVKEFLEKLDEELDKVEKFYQTKENEFCERGEILRKQIQILVDLKQIVHEHRLRRQRSSSSTTLRSIAGGLNSPSFSESAAETDPSSEGSLVADEVIAALERNGVGFIGSARTKAKKGGKPRAAAMRIDIPATTPGRTISAVTSIIWEDLVNGSRRDGSGGGDHINRKKIQCAEKMIRGAFVELYRGLALLKTYSSLNMTAFRKILKKFGKNEGTGFSRPSAGAMNSLSDFTKKMNSLSDNETEPSDQTMSPPISCTTQKAYPATCYVKVSNQQEASEWFLKKVKRSHFVSSDKVVKLADEVESIFTRHFASNDRKKTMKFLRPQQPKDSHMITFLVGLFTGSFVTLFSVYAILAHLSGIFSSTTEAGYVETVYPVFSMFALLSLHIFLYGCNLFMWRGTRINHNFIFEFNPSTALKHRDAFLICTSFMTTVVGAMVIHLLLRSGGVSSQHIESIPGVLLLLFTGLLICPVNIFYRPTRYRFLRVIRNIMFSPFYKVLMVDFFMADQLTSQIPLLRHMEFTACYFMAGGFRIHPYETCTRSRQYKLLAYVISFLPYYWRAMQCARRFIEEGYDANHLANAGKYVSAMLAAAARGKYAVEPTPLWLAVVIISSTAATFYQLYWDFVKDWGFFDPNSKNIGLRDELILKNKCIYYVSIALNFVLRLAWIESVMRLNLGRVENRLVDFLLASSEIIRRGHWNFYRLENEHLNNVGKFRAVKNVPLPFRDLDSDG
ncbi:Phosphate transporter PHO1-2 [Cocos nucifera]|uniref:Phosphate transporter PHO1-2 n=1 Tax=Cocos nucifera TaxID=13894 RepID=A0A8K0N681_COCNU|nr:Phosphate transporter PHO1-2 [Cocos nucifera]